MAELGAGNGATMSWRMQSAEADIKSLQDQKADKSQVDRIESVVNKLIMAIVGGSITIAVSAIGVIVMSAQ